MGTLACRALQNCITVSSAWIVAPIHREVFHFLLVQFNQSELHPLIIILSSTRLFSMKRSAGSKTLNCKTTFLQHRPSMVFPTKFPETDCAFLSSPPHPQSCCHFWQVLHITTTVTKSWPFVTNFVHIFIAYFGVAFQVTRYSYFVHESMQISTEPADETWYYF